MTAVGISALVVDSAYSISEALAGAVQLEEDSHHKSAGDGYAVRIGMLAVES